MAQGVNYMRMSTNAFEIFYHNLNFNAKILQAVSPKLSSETNVNINN
jgi:hypothetical protein